MASNLEYAKLSQVVYGDGEHTLESAGLKAKGWEDTGLIGTNPDSGFFAQAYRKGNEVVIAYRGTEPTQDAFHDILGADVDIGTGDEHQQFVDALEFAKNVQDTYQGLGVDISVTGHSLGGGLAQLAADTFGWGGVTFEAPGMGSYSPPTDGGMIDSFLQANNLSMGNVGDLTIYTVLGSSLSSWAGDHIGTKHDLITQEGQPDLIGQSIEAGIGPAATVAFYAGAGYTAYTVWDQSGRHSMANLIDHLEQAEQEGVLLQQYVDSYLAYGAEGHTAPERTFTETLRDYFSDVFNPDKALTQAQAEDLIGQLDTLKGSDAYADATDAQMADLEKAQDKLRRATQNLVAVSAQKGSWHEKVQNGNTLVATIELEHALERGTQRVALDMPGMDQVTGQGEKFKVVSPNFHVDWAGGALSVPQGYYLEVPSGSKTATLTLRAKADADNLDEVLGDLTVSLPGRSGPNTTYTLSDLTIQDEPLPDTTQDVGSGRTIRGDYVWKDTDPSEPGIQYDYNSLGNRLYETPLQDNPGQADPLYDSAGNDHILPGGGDDDVNAFRGGDDHIEGAGGRDWMEGGAGSDLIEGGAGADLAAGEGQADRIFGGSETNLSDAIAAGNSEANGTNRGEFLAGNGGDDLIVTGNQRDAITGGDGNDVIVAGAGDDAVDADADYSPAGRDWSVDTAGGALTFSPVFPYATDTFGHDVIFLGKGADTAHGGPGADTVQGESGNDAIWGDAGADTLIGGQGADALGGDNGPGVVDPAEHGDDFLDGGAGNDELVGHGGADRLYGGSGDDHLSGSADGLTGTYDGSDYLDGGSGNDNLVGGEAGDRLFGRDGNDYLTGGAADVAAGEDGSDLLRGGTGNDTLVGGGADDSLFGGSGADTLDGDSSSTDPTEHGDDVIHGEAGNDNLVGSGGSDLLSGGEGDDRLTGGAADLEAQYDGNDQLMGGQGDDTIGGSAGSDTLLGGSGQDSLDGDSLDTPASAHGDDYLEGGDGADYMLGSGGSDTLYGGNSGDQLFGDVGGIDSQYHGTDRLYGQEGDDQIVGGGKADTLYGDTGNDELFGDGSADPQSHGSDTLYGGEGDDTLAGSGAGDTLYGESGADRLFGDTANVPGSAHGVDTLFGGSGGDTLIGGGAADTLFGGEGQDQLVGDNTNVDGQFHGGDLLQGGQGNDILAGAGGSDQVLGQAGNDVLVGDSSEVAGEHHGDDYLEGGAGQDQLAGQGGADTLLGGEQSDTLQGGLGGDTLEGGQGGDSLYGGEGDDHLKGQTGDDYLAAGGGSDILEGGQGADLYTYRLGDGGAVIRDPDATNILRFGQGIYAGDITLSLGSLKLNVEGAGSIHIEGFDPDAPDANVTFTRFEFADGTVLSRDQLLAKGFDLTGTAGDDVIEGTVLEDRIRGLAGNDILVGKAGHDRLDGGTGADVMQGQGGNDTYVVDSAGDTVAEAPGAGQDKVEAGVDYGLGSNLEDLELTGDAVVGTGNSGDNTIRGNARDNDLAGGEGADDISGQEGSDVIAGGLGEDALEGDAGNDQLRAGGGADRLSGGEGADALEGGAGGDVLWGGGDSDTLDGGAGADEMEGGEGDDRFFVDDRQDQVTDAWGVTVKNTSAGKEAVYSGGRDRVISRADHRLHFGVEDLELRGSGHEGIGNIRSNQIQGGAGDDTLRAYGLNGYVGPGSQILVSPNSGREERLWDYYNLRYLEGKAPALDPYQTAQDIEIGPEEGDSLKGGAGDDRLIGDLDNDTLTGGAGNDLLFGFGGQDEMRGGKGDDTYVVQKTYDFSRAYNYYLIIPGIGGGYVDLSINYRSDSSDSVTENAGAGTDTVKANSDYVLPENIENLELIEDTQAYLRDGQVYRFPSTYGGTAEVGVGNSLDNRLVGNRYDNQLQGRGGDDTIRGGEGADTLAGQGGRDALFGQTGDDTYVINDGQDTVTELAGQGQDTVRSNLTYELGANVEDLRLTGATAIDGTGNGLNNRIWGNSAANVLRGRAGNDRLDGGKGVDRMVGGAGSDTYYADRTGDQAVEAPSGGIDKVYASTTYQLGSSVENLELTGGAAINGTGNDLANHITGNYADNVLTGKGGSDILDGGWGADTLRGGAGDETYRIDNPGDTIVEGVGNGHDRVISTISYTLAANVEDLALTDDRYIDGTGNTLANSITGTDRTNILSGLAGDDDLDGAAGDDTLEGGAGSDVLYGGDNAWDYQPPYYGEGEGYGGGGQGEYTMRPNADDLNGGAGADHLDGGSGNDILRGGQGDDFLYGGDNGDTPADCGVPYYPEVRLLEGDIGYGASTCALPNRDRLFGGAGADVLDGGTEADDLYGGAGQDHLRGGTGDDTLDGGDGIDAMAGGQGDDTYHVDGYVEVIPPDDGGSGGSGPEDGDEDHDEHPHDSGKGNEGVGNGEDPPPPGHDENRNDGEGTGPGHPGQKSQRAHDEDEDDESYPGNDRPKGSYDAEDDEDRYDRREGRLERESPEGECIADDEGGAGGGDGQQTGPKRIIHTDQVTENAYAGYDRVYASITYTLPAHVEALTLTGTDPLDGTGNADGNWMVGNSAANTLDGAGGADTMWGREGDDTYVVDHEWDRVREFAGNGHDTVRSRISYTLQDRVEDLTLTGEAAIDGTGHGGANALTGNTETNTLKGLGGNDRLTGAGGADLLQGGSGDDTYRFDRGHGADRITDSAGNDRIAFAEGIAPERVVARTATDANGETTASVRVLDEHGSEVPGQRIEITLTNGVSPIERFAFADGTEKTLAQLTVSTETHEGTRRPDAIRTGRNDDIVHASGGPDRVHTGIGNDRLFGQGQPDGLYGQGGHDWLVGGRGSDTLDQGFGNDAAFGGRGHDRLYGSGGNDAQLGGRGHDELTGDAGNDLMAGGSGNDEIEAECGSDVVAFNRGDGRDRIEAGDNLGKLTLSLGGGIALEDLTLRRRGEDLVVGVGPRPGQPGDSEKAEKDSDGREGDHSDEDTEVAGHGRADQDCEEDRSKAGKEDHDESPEHHAPGEALVLEEWYEDDGEHRPESATLQMVTGATAGYDPGADSERLSHRLNRYDFTRIVEAFDQAQADRKGGRGKGRRWDAMDAALDNHLASSDSEALGGELAHRYGAQGSLEGVSRQTVLATLGDERFGEMPQSLKGTGSA